MGYNVSMRSAHFHVPETESVLQVLKDLNKNDHPNEVAPSGEDTRRSLGFPGCQPTTTRQSHP